MADILSFDKQWNIADIVASKETFHTLQKKEKIIAFHSNENEIESNVLGQKVQSFVYVQGSICNIKPWM